MSEENKALVRYAWEEVFNRGNLDAVDEVFAPEWVLHDLSSPGTEHGPEGFKRFLNGFRTAFPDLNATIEDQIAEGSKVVSRFTERGTHQGEFRGVAPTGHRVMVTGIGIFRIEGGKIAEAWVNRDDLGLLEQIGAVPSRR